jgi:hypothetical protein
MANFPPFAKTILKKEYSATNSLKKKIRQKNIFFTKNCHNYLQHERVLKSFFLLSYFEYCQIKRNILTSDRHLGNVTKLKEKQNGTLNS